MPSFVQVLILAIVQGLAELLPVSSSAHVVVAEKLMGLDPSAPEMTLLLVMLHTGTMFAVVLYFWQTWRATYFSSAYVAKEFGVLLVLATAITGAIGEVLIVVIEKVALRSSPAAEVEQLFGRLELIAPALAAAGILILVAGLAERKRQAQPVPLGARQAGVIGAVQGLCLPFRGFSRSGATISSGMLAGVAKDQAEKFSFALAVLLTPAAIGREALRLFKAGHNSGMGPFAAPLVPCLLGAALAFLAGLLALKWLSRWLETGRWYLFGIYCLLAAAVVATLRLVGY
ncbi:MAG: undecaprenyl-diphosphate phosphatase [Bryobacteraceae bacterium]